MTDKSCATCFHELCWYKVTDQTNSLLAVTPIKRAVQRCLVEIIEVALAARCLDYRPGEDLTFDDVAKTRVVTLAVPGPDLAKEIRQLQSRLGLLEQVKKGVEKVLDQMHEDAAGAAI